MGERIAVVGTRSPSLRQVARVFSLVAAMPNDAVVVSGGARGIDTWARRAAEFYRRGYDEHTPDIYAEHLTYGDACKRRNEDIANDCDWAHALPGPEYPQRGGTGHTVRATRRLGKTVMVWAYPDADWPIEFEIWAETNRSGKVTT